MSGVRRKLAPLKITLANHVPYETYVSHEGT